MFSSIAIIPLMGELLRRTKYFEFLILMVNPIKELSFCHTLKSSDPNICATRWCKPLIFQAQIILSISINSLKNLRSMTLGCKDIENRKSQFVAKTQLLWFSPTHGVNCIKLQKLRGRKIIPVRLHDFDPRLLYSLQQED